MNKVLLNKSLYNFKSVNGAISAFRNIADIDLSENNNYWILTFMYPIYDVNITKRELENYLIDLIIDNNEYN